MKRWIHFLVVGLLFFTMATPSFAASSFGRYSSSHSIQVPGNSSSTLFRSGTQRPSSSVSNPGIYQNPHSYTPPSSYAPQSHWGSFLGGMATGSLLSSMFHPFSGYGYGGYSHGYGLGSGLILDVIIAAVIIWLVQRLRRKI